MNFGVKAITLSLQMVAISYIWRPVGCVHNNLQGRDFDDKILGIQGLNVKESCRIWFDAEGFLCYILNNDQSSKYKYMLIIDNKVCLFIEEIT